MLITLIWFPLYRYLVTVQVFFCVNITTFGLLTAGVVLCYSHVRPCIKGHMNLSLDISCSLWLRCSHRVQHRLTHLSTHDCLWIFPVLKHLTTRVVCGCGPRFTPCKTRANFGASPLVLLTLTRVVALCYHGVPLVLTRGEGVDPC